MFNISRLVKVSKIIRRKSVSKSRFDNTFDDFGYEGKVGNRTIIREVVLVRMEIFITGDMVDFLRIGWN